MEIDNRVFITPAAPFVFIFLARAVFGTAGAPISEPGPLAAICLIFGPLAGAGFTAFLFDQEISLGKIRIGRKS